MNSAKFARKAIDADELKCRTDMERDKSAFVIEKVIELTVEQYRIFCSDLLCDYDFIKDNSDKMFVDSNGVWHCILIKTADSRDGILVEAEGYGYCRYGSYIADCGELVKPVSSPFTELIKAQILEIRAEGKYNMFDLAGVQKEAHVKGFYELVVFLKEHRKEYANYILTGQG